jgi:hypothetical protein
MTEQTPLTEGISTCPKCGGRLAIGDTGDGWTRRELCTAPGCGWEGEYASQAEAYASLRELRRLREENERLTRDAAEEFSFLWQTYALAEDSELTHDARELKRRLLEITGMETLREVVERLKFGIEIAYTGGPIPPLPTTSGELMTYASGVVWLFDGMPGFEIVKADYLARMERLKDHYEAEEGTEND